jgi:hypothetical protein
LIHVVFSYLVLSCLAGNIRIVPEKLLGWLALSVPLSIPQKRDVSLLEVMHPMHERSPTNWYENILAIIPTCEFPHGRSAAQTQLVNKVENIAHREGNQDRSYLANWTGNLY